MNQLSDEFIIELAVNHSNYREGKEFEVISHDRLIEFARELIAHEQELSLQYVRIPNTADEAEAMERLGFMYLSEHAPERLKAPLVDEVRFLLDRLDDFEGDLGENDVERQYAGHVMPSVSRIRKMMETH